MQLVNTIRRELYDRFDEKFEEAGENCTFLPDETFAEIRNTLFLHIDDVTITENDISIHAFAGIWHWAAGRENQDCPANTASAMFASQRPLPMFRHYQHALSHKSLQPWMEEYQKNAKELASIALRNPLLTARLIRLASDLRPVLNEKGKVPLPVGTIEELTPMAKLVAQNASPELSELVRQVMEVLSKGEGHVFNDLVDLAAKSAPRRRKRKV